MKRHLKILQELIQIESVNDGEEAVANYIADLFKAYKTVETELIPSYPGRANILVKLKGTRPGKIFAVSGHLDVVETGEGWTHPPFEGVIEGNKMYGRGTCDMKAGVAAALAMMLDLADEGADFAGEIWFIGTVGEEVGMQGALDLVEGGHLDGVDGIIIPEPTKRDGENQAIFASKGSIMYTIHGEGKAAHSSMPELGINAIMTAAEFIQTTQKAFDEVTNNPDYHNDELGTTLNVFSVIEGGRQFNSVPDHVVIKGNARTVPEYDSARAVELLQAAVDKNNENPEKATLTLELNQVLDAAQAKKDTALIRALKEAGKDKNIQVRPLIGTCELSRYIHLPGDVDLVVYGPGLTKMAHKVDEYIEIDEYEDTIRLFKDTAQIFLKSE